MPRHQQTKPRLPRIALVTGLVFVAMGCAAGGSRADPEDLSEFATAGEIVWAGNTLAFKQGGTPGKPLVIFIHGTPGTWHAFESYLRNSELREQVHMIAIDRLGFGGSSASGVQDDFARHSAAIAELFQFNQSAQPITVVGHSLGGTLALQVAVDHPQQVGAFLSISAALSPELSNPRWYHRLADLPLIKQIIPNDLHLANEEMLILKQGLENIAPQMRSFSGKVGIIQGGKDPLVNAGHADFAEAQLVNADVMVHRFPERGHFIVWEQQDFVVAEILRLVHGPAETETN